jgi:hypothetical protein
MLLVFLSMLCSGMIFNESGLVSFEIEVFRYLGTADGARLVNEKFFSENSLHNTVKDG